MRHCEICDAEIPAGRLDAVPDTQLCMTHAREMDKYGGEFKLTGVYGNIGKSGSLKKTYGDVSVLKERNVEGLTQLRQKYEQEKG